MYPRLTIPSPDIILENLEEWENYRRQLKEAIKEAKGTSSIQNKIRKIFDEHVTSRDPDLKFNSKNITSTNSGYSYCDKYDGIEILLTRVYDINDRICFKPLDHIKVTIAREVVYDECVNSRDT